MNTIKVTIYRGEEHEEAFEVEVASAVAANDLISELGEAIFSLLEAAAIPVEPEEFGRIR